MRGFWQVFSRCFRSETTISTQNTQNAPKARFSIGNHDFHPEHADCTENQLPAPVIPDFADPDPDFAEPSFFGRVFGGFWEGFGRFFGRLWGGRGFETFERSSLSEAPRAHRMQRKPTFRPENKKDSEPLRIGNPSSRELSRDLRDSSKLSCRTPVVAMKINFFLEPRFFKAIFPGARAPAPRSKLGFLSKSQRTAQVACTGANDGCFCVCGKDACAGTVRRTPPLVASHVPCRDHSTVELGSRILGTTPSERGGVLLSSGGTHPVGV